MFLSVPVQGAAAGGDRWRRKHTRKEVVQLSALTGGRTSTNKPNPAPASARHGPSPTFFFLLLFFQDSQEKLQTCWSHLMAVTCTSVKPKKKKKKTSVNDGTRLVVCSSVEKQASVTWLRNTVTEVTWKSPRFSRLHSFVPQITKINNMQQIIISSSPSLLPEERRPCGWRSSQI